MNKLFLNFLVLLCLLACNKQKNPAQLPTNPLGSEEMGSVNINNKGSVDGTDEQSESIEQSSSYDLLKKSEIPSTNENAEEHKKDLLNLTPNENYIAAQDYQGGFIDGNSANFITNENNPWFLSDKDKDTFTYCLSVPNEADYSNLYSISLENADQLINTALAQWHEVLEKMRSAINYKIEDQIFLNNQLDDLNILDRNPKKIVSLATKVPCEEKPDLVFLFAPENSQNITQIKNIDTKIGAAIRTDYNADRLWSSGIIWVVPDKINSIANLSENIWQDLWRFHAVILHELGHVYGFPHNSIEIMEESFPLAIVSREQENFQHLMFKNESYQDKFLVSPKSIFGQSWLYSNQIERYSYAADKNILRQPEIDMMRNLSGKNIVNGFPEEINFHLMSNGVWSSFLEFLHNTDNKNIGGHNYQLSTTFINFNRQLGTTFFPKVGIGSLMVKSVTINPVFTKLSFKIRTQNNTWVEHPLWLLAIPPKNDYIEGELLPRDGKYSVIIEKKNFGRDLLLKIKNTESIFITFFTKIITPKTNFKPEAP